MKLIGCAALLIVVLSASEFGSGVACAGTELTDFNGSWHDGGTDRSTPLEATQRTSCSAGINADLRRMSANIVCKSVAGLTKVIRLNITLAGNTFSGDLTQKATIRGENPSELNGSVSGQKTDTTANFKVSFRGLTPSVEVTLKLNNPSSFSMRAITLGSQLMDVTFNRSGKE